jgi:hypothetical protein
MLTDLFTACISLILYVKLIQENQKSLGRILWSSFFLLFGISTLISGIGHGIDDPFGHNVLVSGWILGVLSVFFIENATFNCMNNKKYQNVFRIFSTVQLIVTITMIFKTQIFLPVTISSAVGMAGIVLPLRIFMISKYKDINSKKIATAIGIAFLSAIVHTFKLSFHRWFNYKDISHVILSVSLIFFFLGARGELSIFRTKSNPE